MRSDEQNDNLITVGQARKILGSRADKLTDAQITSFLNMLRLLCNKQIDSALQKNHLKTNSDQND